MTEAWSWVLTAFGLTTMWLAGRKVWWAWFVGLAGQTAWLAYGLVTHQLGFLVGAAAYSFVYARNASLWTHERERRGKHEHDWVRVGYGGAGWSLFRCECGAEDIDA